MGFTVDGTKNQRKVMELVRITNGFMFVELWNSHRTYRIALNGGTFTRYSIWPYRGKDESKKGSHFRVKSHFDNSTATVTKDDIFNHDKYHFKEAIEKGALYLEADA
jgi:hypothetical protein